MIDTHCHIMPGVDDGSKNLEESLIIFENAATSGVTDVVLTPHYIKETRYQYNNNSKQKLLEILKEALKRADIDLNIYYGNEVYIDESVLDLLKKGEISTLANSRYLLIELPLYYESHSTPEVIFELMSHDIVPIIAHPERYTYFQQHPRKIDRYLELGCLLQGNYQSLFGKYGSKAKSTLKTLLKEDKIHLLASDTHHASDDYYLPEAAKKVYKIVKSRRKVHELFVDNPERIIKNEEV